MFSFKVLCNLLTLIIVSLAAPVSEESSSTKDLFPTNIGFLGNTATGVAPFLAQTNGAAQKTGTPTTHYTLPQPVETSVQGIGHNETSSNIFEHMGALSPYYVSDGWGVFEYGLPTQCRIKEAHIVSRHGTRYPAGTNSFAVKVSEAGNFTAKGDLEFLNEWTYKMGSEILTSLGNQQLFDKGVKNFFKYGELYDWSKKSNIVARTTSQERMTESALYFLNGFFGLDWQNYVDLEIIIENSGFNNTLVYYESCPNDDIAFGLGINVAANYEKEYLMSAVERLNSEITGNLTFTASDLNNMQTLCAYETQILGFSKFCNLFTQKEWEDYGYYEDFSTYYNSFFGYPLARAGGIGWVDEFKQRLTHSTFNSSEQSIQNSTLDSDPTYFPTNQSLYMDFTHDTSILSIFAALGLDQFKSNFTGKGPQYDQQPFKVSELVPFAASFTFEIIECDHEVPNDRSSESVTNSNSTDYVHLVLNDNTLSLSRNIPKYCESRLDGWCNLNDFIDYLDTLYEASRFEYSCFGNITVEPVIDGVPL